MRVFLFVVGVFALTVVGDAVAGMNEFESCRCSYGIATKGDHKPEVEQKCGKPVKVLGGYGRDCQVMWLYNFGPNEFMQGVCFAGDRVRKVVSLTRGY